MIHHKPWERDGHLLSFTHSPQVLESSCKILPNKTQEGNPGCWQQATDSNEPGFRATANDPGLYRRCPTARVANVCADLAPIRRTVKSNKNTRLMDNSLHLLFFYFILQSCSELYKLPAWLKKPQGTTPLVRIPFNVVVARFHDYLANISPGFLCNRIQNLVFSYPVSSLLYCSFISYPPRGFFLSRKQLETTLFSRCYVLHPSVLFLLLGGCPYLSLGCQVLHFDVSWECGFLCFMVHKQHKPFAKGNRDGRIYFDIHVFRCWINYDDCVLQVFTSQIQPTSLQFSCAFEVWVSG